MVYVVFGCIGTNLISFSVNFLKDLYQTAKKVCKYLGVRLGIRFNAVKDRVSKYEGETSNATAGIDRANS